MNEGAPICPFCPPDPGRVFYRGEAVLALWDGFPVTEGHALIVPVRHVPTWFDASEEERRELADTIGIVREIIERQYHPDGFNIGINVGEAGGQTVFHLHVHVIPRYRGDVPNPRGGVRHVIPGKGDYGCGSGQPAAYDSTPGYAALRDCPHVESLIRGGGADALLPHLRAGIDRANRVEMAVAFVLPSGVGLLWEHLRDLLDRGGSLRLLTGDYMQVTDPRALRELLDLQGDARLRVYQTAGKSFHPKAYILHFPDEAGVAYVGSSNLTRSALADGVEWNYRVVRSSDAEGFRSVVEAFEALYDLPATRPIDADWIDDYARRRVDARRAAPGGGARVDGGESGPEGGTVVEVEPEAPEPPPEPWHVQQEALDVLRATREAGNRAGLVVLATGLGKTWLSAFDSNDPAFRRVLFVAHREEILAQARRTFRRIRPEAHMGTYSGREKHPGADVLFASVQTLGRLPNLRRFPPDRFDYIVIDEFHHAAAATYRKVIDHFEPKFLLGITATPERTDGGDLLGLCQENLVYRCDLFEGIRRGRLVPFHYFGVPDEVDYKNIPWRSTRFDEEELTRALATRKRAQNALEQYRSRAGRRTLSFCCSIAHADFMADFFGREGLHVASVHSGPTADPRATSLERLAAGELDVVFSIDMFNEGVDLPDVDTVMMLRPTESSTLWTQQFGRGLRTAEGKDRLTVIDYIGNHRVFKIKPRTLFGIGPGDGDLAEHLRLVERGEVDLPPGCEVTYELEAIRILRSMIRRSRTRSGWRKRRRESARGISREAFRAYYEEFRERRGERPTALEAFHDGYAPRATGAGSWLRFVREMGDLSEGQETLLEDERLRAFLEFLESTPMSKSYKMVTLLAMLNQDALPGRLLIADFMSAFARVAGRSAILRRDISVPLDDPGRLRRLLEENPINAWVGGRGTGGRKYFRYDEDVFETTLAVPSELRADFQEWVREIVEWRLAEYLDRAGSTGDSLGDGEIVCAVSHAGGRPMLFLPDRASNPGIPSGWTRVLVEDQEYEANFVKVAVNVMRRVGEETNALPSLLRGWFGPDAGLPGTRFRVSFEPVEDGYRMKPLGRPSSRGEKALWRQYSREEIPPLWGFEFTRGAWNSGMVVKDKHVFLLVTLEKKDLVEEFQFEDHFISADRFQWQSQNRTTQASKQGRLLKNHAEEGVEIHLFVRASKKIGSVSAPFVYCGEVDFVDWEGEKPITVQWQLREPVPERLHGLLDIDA